MDLDISDILASVTRANPGTLGTHANGNLLGNSSQQQADLQDLTRAWISERVAPELLHYPTDLMERTMRRLRQQVGPINPNTRITNPKKIETIEDSTARMDAGTSFGLVIIQTELERFKFLVRSFLRARLAKIDSHSLHILNLHKSQSQDEAHPLLSSQELQYLMTHAAILERHYNASFFSSFPPKLRRLDDRAGAGGSGMVEGPDLDKAVFVRCLGAPTGTTSHIRNDRGALDDFDDNMDMNDDMQEEQYRPVSVSCGYVAAASDDRARENSTISTQSQSQAQDAERIIEMHRGDIWMVRWSAVRDAVRTAECELL